MEKVRDNYYSNQIKSVKEMKNMGSAGVRASRTSTTTRFKTLEYSSGQLDRCHENYIFQRQRY